MTFLANLKLRNKLALMLLFPLLAVLYFSATGAVEKWRQAREMGSLLALSELAVKISALVHESQRERGMTALFLGSKGTKFREELTAQRAQTDKQVASLRGYLGGFDRTRLGVEFGKSLDDALARMDKTAGTRDAVSGLSIAAPDAIAHYTGLNTALLRVIARSTHLSDQGDLARRLTAYVSFLQAKERTGIERAMLSNTFAQDAFAPGMYERAITVVTAKDTYGDVFESLATADDREFAKKTLTGPAVDEVARMRKLAFEKAATGNFGTDPGHWFKTITEQINLMKQVEDRLSETLIAQARRLETQAWSALTLFLALGVVALGVASAVGYLVVRNILQSINAVLATVSELAAGNLTQRIALASRDELGKMGAAVNAFIDTLHGLIGQIRDAAQQAGSAARQLAEASEHLSTGAQEQASSIEETAASLEEITGTVKQNADNARQASQLAVGSRSVAEEGGHVVEGAVQSMSEINQSSKKIADIITTIDEIAFQTNLLALNAAVEAARAGEQGRGFAVVAAEVRNLAQRSATAAKEIKGLIKDSVQKVGAGSQLVNKSGETLSGIVSSVKRVTDLVSEIAAACQEQSMGVDQVNKAVIQMDQVTQSNAAQTEELSSTAQALAGQAARLQELIAHFTLEESPVPEEATRRDVRGPSPTAMVKRPSKPIVAPSAPRAEPALVGAHAGHDSRQSKDDSFEEF